MKSNKEHIFSTFCTQLKYTFAYLYIYFIQNR
jgi:hypothetical protein